MYILLAYVLLQWYAGEPVSNGRLQCADSWVKYCIQSVSKLDDKLWDQIDNLRWSIICLETHGLRRFVSAQEGPYRKGLKETDKHSFQSKRGLSILLSLGLFFFWSSVAFSINYSTFFYIHWYYLLLSVVSTRGGWVNLILLCYSILLYRSMWLSL